MMSNNKILTVSYGTFSCTLEGFEDSFDTMKAIAEYFRDLAQEDRYFGAEPAKPDAEMMARIAEREIARRVEAKAGDEGIHLRASAAATAAITAAAADAPATQQEPEAEAAQPAADVQESVESVDDAEDIAADDAISSVLVDAAQDDAADTALVDDTAVGAAATDGADDHEDVIAEVIVTEDDESHDDEIDLSAALDTAEADDTDDLILGALAADEDTDAPEDADVAPEEFDMAEDTDEDDDDIVEAEAVFDADEFEEDEPVAEAGATTSIAAKLQRIRAVVAKNRASSDGYSEDEHAEDLATPANASVDFDAIQDELYDVETVDEFRMVDTPALENFETDAVQDSVAVEDDSTEDELSALISQLGDDDASDDLDLDLETRAEDDDTLEIDADDIPEFDEDDFASLGDIEDDAEEDAESLIAAALEADDAPAARGRVVSVKREDLEAALESGALDDYEDAVEEDAVADAAADASSLSDEDEDDLMRALAEVEAELPETSEEDAASFEEVSEDDLSGAELLEETTESEEAELDRLMAEADNQMEEPESSSRRSAFSHLRAAVAATKADDKLSEEATSEEDDGAYRTDLAEAVKPRRPALADLAEQNDRPQTARPAPLKLVAEQRITETMKSDGPVAPRRVAAEEDTAPISAGGSFADYAASQGASELSDLLEAAASYLSFVEGRDQFSRPQLMTKVRQVGPEGFTREDGLRSFGQLLRSGKISKIKGGRFTVSEDIGFQPDQRAAG